MTHRLIMNSPLKLQVLLWSVDQVCAWAAKLGFSPAPFAETRVDGDLLLQLDEKNLKEDSTCQKLHSLLHRYNHHSKPVFVNYL